MSCINKSLGVFKDLVTEYNNEVFAEEVVRSYTNSKNSKEFIYPTVKEANAYLSNKRGLQTRLVGEYLNTGKVLTKPMLLKMTKGLLHEQNGVMFITKGSGYNKSTAVSTKDMPNLIANKNAILKLAESYPANFVVKQGKSDPTTYIVEYAPTAQHAIAFREQSKFTDKRTLNKETLVKIAEGLKKRTGVEYAFVSAAEAVEMLKDIENKEYILKRDIPVGFYSNGVAIFVEDNLTDDVVWHEFSHAIINAIYKDNKALFNNLYSEIESTQEGRDLINHVKNTYSKLKEGSIDFKKEVVVTALGYLSDGKFKDKESQGIVEYLKQLLQEVSNYLKLILKINVDPKYLASNKLTLSDLSSLIVNGTGNINLGTEVTNTTSFKYEMLGSEEDYEDYEDSEEFEVPQKKTISQQIIPTTQQLPASNTIVYTPTGKETQTYTVKGSQIFNKNNVEVFKKESRDRTKIFANLAVKQGTAIVVDYKDAKYVVNNKDQIVSVVSGKVVQWPEENGNRKAVLELAKQKLNLIQSKLPTTQQSTSVKVISENYGVLQAETNLTETITRQFVNLIQPQIQKQAYQENITGNKMFMFGLRWTRKSKAIKPLNIKSYANKGLPITDAKATDGYVYDTVDQNGNSLAPISDLQPIIAEIEKTLGIDMSDYDAVIGNIYLPGQRIQTHRDTTESLSARNYPVVVYTIGAGNAINIYENVKNPGLASFASDKKTLIPTKNGTIYTFGMNGKGRFELGHDTPHAIKKGDTQIPITMPDGTVIKDYTITLTFRRAADLELGMPTAPTKITPTQSSTSVKPAIVPKTAPVKSKAITEDSLPSIPTTPMSKISFKQDEIKDIVQQLSYILLVTNDYRELLNKLRNPRAVSKELIEVLRSTMDDETEASVIEHYNNVINDMPFFVDELYKHYKSFNKKLGTSLIKDKDLLNDNFKSLLDLENVDNTKEGSIPEDGDEDGNPIRKSHNEISDVESADYRVKLLIANTPLLIKDSEGVISMDLRSYLGLPKFVNFIDLYKYVKKELSGIVYDDNTSKDPLVTMKEHLQELTEYKPEISDLLSRLEEQSEQVQSLFFRTFSSTEYVYSTLTIKKGKNGYMDIRVMDSDITSGAETVVNEWNAEAVDNLTILYSDNNRRYAKELTEDKYREYYNILATIDKSLIEAVKNKDYSLTRGLIRRVQSMLTSYGIKIKDQTLRHAIDSLNADEKLKGLKKLLASNSYSLASYIKSVSIDLRGIILETDGYRDKTEIHNQGGLKKLAELEVLYRPDLGEESVMGAEGFTYQKFSNNTMKTKRLSELNKFGIANGKLKAILSSAYSKHSLMAEFMLNGGVLTPVLLNNYKEIGKGDKGTKTGNLKPTDTATNIINRQLEGQFIGIAEADKTNQFAMKGMHLVNTSVTVDADGNLIILEGTEDSAINVLMGYLADEIDRIRLTHLETGANQSNISDVSDIEQAYDILSADEEIEHYHYAKTPGDRKGQAFKLHAFVGLDLKELGLLHDNEYGTPRTLLASNFYENKKVRERVKAIYLATVEKEIKYFIDNRVISKVDGVLVNNSIASKHFGIDSNYMSIENVIATYTLNALIGNIEDTKLFNGDPAFYAEKKGNIFADFIKRTGPSVSGYDTRIFKNEDGTWAVPPTYTSAVVHGIIKPSSVYLTPILDKDGEITGYAANEEIVALIFENRHPDSKLTKQEIRKQLEKYADTNQTDAQAWITIDLYKERMRGFGKWSPEHDIAFENIKAGRYTAADNAMFAQPLKTVHFELIMVGGKQVPHYNKQSEAVLLPILTKNTPLDSLRVAMESAKIGHVIVSDGKKTGASGVTSLVDDKGKMLSSDKMVFNTTQLSNNYLFLQQDLPTKNPTQLDEKSNVKVTLVGSQAVKNIMANIQLNKTYKLNDKPLSGRELLELYHNVNSKISDHYTNKLLEELTTGSTGTLDIGKFNKALAEELKGDVSDSVIDAIKLGMPLDAIPAVKTLSQHKALAMFKNAAVKLKQPGGGFIQLSDFGIQKSADSISDKLFDSILFLKNKNTELYPPRVVGKSIIKPAQIILPYSALFKIPGVKDMSPAEIAESIASGALNGFMYRIPNQALSSNDAFEIVGFLPPEAGDTVIAYSDITTKTGTDFDIDKAFVILPHVYYNDVSGKLEKIGYNEGALNGSNIKSLENLKLDLMIAMLSDPKSFYDRITPLDNPWLADLVDRLSPDEFITSPLSFFTGSNQAIIKSTLDQAKGLVGIVANHMTDHAVSQLDHLEYTTNYKIGNTDINGTAISKIFNTDKEFISSISSVFANAIIDAAKTPTLLHRLNLNTITAPSAFFLIRTGASKEWAASFIMQPVLKELVRRSNTSEGKLIEYIRDNENNIVTPEQVIITKLVEQDPSIAHMLADSPSKILNYVTSISKATLEDQMVGKTDYRTQYMILKLFKSYTDAGKLLNDSVSVSKQDVNGGGKTLMDAFVLDNKIKTLLRSNKIFGLHRKLGITPLGSFDKSRMLSTFTHNSAVLATELLSPVFLSASNAYRQVLYDIVKNTNPDLIKNAEMLNLLTNEIYAYLLATADNPISGNSKSLMFGVNSVPSQINTAKITDDLKDNLLISYLKVNLSNSPDLPSFAYVNRDKQLDPDSERNLYKAWLEIYEHANPDYRHFAIRLVKYSYVATGFAPSFGSFYHLIPPTILSEIGFVDFIKQEKANAAKSNLYLGNSASLQIIKNLSNHHKLLKMIPNLDMKPALGLPTNIAFELVNKDSLAKIGTSKNYGSSIYASYVRNNVGDLFRLIEISEQSDNPIYILESSLGIKKGIHTLREYSRDNNSLMSMFDEENNVSLYNEFAKPYADKPTIMASHYDMQEEEYYYESDESIDDDDVDSAMKTCE